MHLNHINLVVTQVSEAARFFETYFDFVCTEIKGDSIIAVLKDKSDFTLVLMRSKDVPVIYPGAFHIGFMQDSPEKVDDIYQRLKTALVPVGAPPGKIRDSYGFYFHFDNILIEIGYDQS